MKGKKLTIYLPATAIEKMDKIEGESNSQKIQNAINNHKSLTEDEKEVSYLREFHDDVKKSLLDFFSKKYSKINFNKSTRGVNSDV